MKTATANFAWLHDEGKRLDASFHLSEGREAKILIKKSPFGFKTLEQVSLKLSNGGRFRRNYVDDPEKGIPYLTASDMTNAQPLSGTYLSKKMTANVESLMLHKGWLLISCSGTIGKVVYTNEDFEGQIGTHDLIRILPNPDEIEPGYLYAFLASKHGFALLTQSNYGGVVKHIEPHHITELPIPVLRAQQRKEIHFLIEEAAKLRVEGNGLLKEAESMLISALDIDSGLLKKLTSPLEKDIKQSFLIDSSRISALTLRARNYSPRLKAVIELLSKNSHERLIDVLHTEPFYTNRFKRITSKSANAVELLSQGVLFDMKPKGILLSSKYIPEVSSQQIAKGTILVAGQGSLGENEIFGRAKFVWGYLENRIVAQHVIRFIPDNSKINEGYLFTVINSKFWFRIFRSIVCGTNLLGFIIPMLNEMPVPRLGENLEQEIGQKVKTAYDKLTQANEKENKAISTLENEISSWQQSKQIHTATLQ